MNYKYVYLFTFLMFLPQIVSGLNFEVGGGSAIVKSKFKKQTYQDQNGLESSITPKLESNIIGNTYHASIGINWFALEYGMIEYKYEVSREISYNYNSSQLPNERTTNIIEEQGNGNISSSYYGILLKWKREIGGLYIGMGNIKSVETLIFENNEYEFESEELYYQGGVEIFLGILSFRAGVIEHNIGKHKMQVTCLKVLFTF